MSEDNPSYFKSLEDWRNWLKVNHNKLDGFWLIIQKKASKKQGIHYDEAVLEAVAYGWIDGKMKSINEDEFKQRFTPRRSGSIWSLYNRERAQKLLDEGRMTEAGLKTVEEAKNNGQWDKAYSSSRGPVETPEDLLVALKKNQAAYNNFHAWPPSARFMYIHWLNEAKQQVTRQRRIDTIVDRSEKNLRPGINLRIVKK
ncbi:bacteriocin-protection protein [Candidatus Bathyarchaeota archaeon]|nr:bacteriocin-protection protein [Candidatus Bathyarchaeota archaeon]